MRHISSHSKKQEVLFKYYALPERTLTPQQWLLGDAIVPGARIDAAGRAVADRRITLAGHDVRRRCGDEAAAHAADRRGSRARLPNGDGNADVRSRVRPDRDVFAGRGTVNVAASGKRCGRCKRVTPIGEPEGNGCMARAAKLAQRQPVEEPVQRWHDARRNRASCQCNAL